MTVILSQEAITDIGTFDKTLKKFFQRHFEKIERMPPRRHMGAGLPFFVENVTNQARFTYQIEARGFFVLRCFATHKEYQRWYKSFG